MDCVANAIACDASGFPAWDKLFSYASGKRQHAAEKMLADVLQRSRNSPCIAIFCGWNLFFFCGWNLFFFRSLAPADQQTGYRDPIEGIRRIEVKGRTRGYSIRLTTNEWYKATQLGDSYWLYVVRDHLGINPELVVIRNPAAKLEHAKKEIVAARYYEIPAEAIDRFAGGDR